MCLCVFLLLFFLFFFVFFFSLSIISVVEISYLCLERKWIFRIGLMRPLMYCYNHWRTLVLKSCIIALGKNMFVYLDSRLFILYCDVFARPPYSISLDVLGELSDTYEMSKCQFMSVF